MPIKRTYPRVGNIKDQDTQQALRILFDRIWDLTDTVNATSGGLASVQGDLSTLQASHAALQRTVQINSAPATATVAPDGGVTGPNPPPPTSDDGKGQLGCSEAGSTGHLATPIDITPESAGKIVCGVGAEFPGLLAVTVDQPTRDTNQNELLDRMVWHLNQQGFPTARYPASNPEARKWVLIIGIGQDGYVYRVLEYADYTVPLQTTMVFGSIAAGQLPTPDPGTPD